ncbi:cytochrome P450 4V2-like [Choristoneura fumiferana]|uniref:cytochrome P450 4V2-like n=1 Tax=Choristoneura fumiferana TaxID=7141 RepID=UPI003D15F2A4
MFWLLLFIALCIWSMCYTWERRRIREIYNQIPKLGFMSYPIIGHAYLFGKTNEERMDGLITIAKRAIELGGLTSVWMANRLYIVVCDPNVAEVVLKHCPDKDDTTMRIMRSFTGNGSVFTTVNIWRPRRKVLAPVFSIKNLQGFVSEFARQATIMTKLLEQEVGRNEISMWNYFNTYTFDAICKNSLGIDINSQNNRYHPFPQAFEDASSLLGRRIVSPWLYWDFIYGLMPEAKKVAYSRKVAYDFVDNLVRLKREELAALKSNNEPVQNKTFLDMLIESSSKIKGYSDVELREEVIVILTAGSDTSAVGTAYTAVMLSRYPEVQEKVYQELEEVFGNNSRPVTAADLPKLVYLEAVVKETLRLYPPGPIYVRETHSDCKLPNGLTVPKGVALAFILHGMHRNPKYWGDDAEQFRPERFLEGRLRHPVQFIPFSYSIRNCIGGTYAMMSIKTVLATMLRRYRLLPPAGLDPQQIKEPLPVSFNIMMRHVDNYTLRLEYRN